jgi:hypothetical protein
MITKEYCRCTVRVEKAGLRRAATVRAAKLLGSIVKEGTVKLSKATVDASKTKLSQALKRYIVVVFTLFAVGAGWPKLDPISVQN